MSKLADMADNRGPWIIAIAIVIAAGLVVGAWAYFRGQDQSCEEWQAEYRATVRRIAREAVDQSLTAEEIADDPVAYNATRDLAESQPDGCSAPT